MSDRVALFRRYGHTSMRTADRVKPRPAQSQHEAVRIDLVGCPQRAIGIENPRWQPEVRRDAAHELNEPLLPAALDVAGTRALKIRHSDSWFYALRGQPEIRCKHLIVHGDLEDREESARTIAQLKHPQRAVRRRPALGFRERSTHVIEELGVARVPADEKALFMDSVSSRIECARGPDEREVSRLARVQSFDDLETFAPRLRSLLPAGNSDSGRGASRPRAPRLHTRKADARLMIRVGLASAQ